MRSEKCPIYALVDCNNFYASCERVFNPMLEKKPVIVLSNNDGCAVAMSREAKDCGIRIGTPIFKVMDIVKQMGAHVFSSNYALYGDMSARVMDTLTEFSPDIEIYSIDESFLRLDHLAKEPALIGVEIKKTVKKWTGIPVSVGIAKTKTLSKLANHIAKKNDQYEGVFCLDENDNYYFDNLPVEEVWGVGRQNLQKLNRVGIFTISQLREASDSWIKNHLGGVVGMRTVLELRGTPCIDMDYDVQPKKGVVSSRSFGIPVETKRSMQEAVATYFSRAAVKLRRQNSVTGIITVFINTNRFRDEPQYNNSITYRLPVPTSNTNELIKYGMILLDKIFKSGYKYKKAGVMLTEITSASEVQGNLFTIGNDEKGRTLMKYMDFLNDKMGANTMKFARLGINNNWSMKRDRMSSRYTTNWSELPLVR